MSERPTPSWAVDMPKDSFLSYNVTYECGKYLSLFEQDIFQSQDEIVKTIKYYFYDPTKHGYPKNKSYPILIFLHGATNSFVGDMCINYSGAEHYATEEYQKSLGGAYLLIPIANEYRGDDGKLYGCWNEEYLEPVYNLIHDFIKRHTEGVGKKFLLGNSAGARFTFDMGNTYTDYFDGLIPVGSTDIPDDEKLDEYEKKGISLFFAIGKRDEFHSYKEEVEPRLSRLKAMKGCFIFTPDWVYNGDRGIASVYAGVEMGQHCLMNSIQANLMFDDGCPMDSRLPRGLTGWIDEMNRI